MSLPRRRCLPARSRRAKPRWPHRPRTRWRSGARRRPRAGAPAKRMVRRGARGLGARARARGSNWTRSVLSRAHSAISGSRVVTLLCRFFERNRGPAAFPPILGLSGWLLPPITPVRPVIRPVVVGAVVISVAVVGTAISPIAVAVRAPATASTGRCGSWSTSRANRISPAVNGSDKGRRITGGIRSLQDGRNGVEGQNRPCGFPERF